MVDISKMRACVKWAFEHGVEGSAKEKEWQKFRHAIIFECKRLDIDRAETKQMILAWNARNLSSLTQNDAKRQLCGYVDWFYKQDNAKLSCKALQDYCNSNDVFCIFAKKESIKPLSYSLTDACSFLEKNDRNGYVLGKVLKLVISLREELKLDRIFMGTRKLCTLFFDRENVSMLPMEMLRYLRKLSDLGFLSIESGQPGTFGRKANEYTVLDWKPE